MVDQYTDYRKNGNSSLWYKDTVIYEAHIRAFADSDGDGIGDIPGLIGKLDYIEHLGVTALWLLPFYPSPLRDDGYDISDYTHIQPVYGSMHDFKVLIDEAHRRGIRIITELVLNHTSDQHPWFQRARRAPARSRWRNFYVWSETPDKYKEARIIFKDYERSNWAWDPVARSYYWHRFYSHQPDLNYDSPDVRQAMFRVVDFWLGLGVDGLRADAAPYLFEREGSSCENLPETHAFIRELRAHVDRNFHGRMLLAEANQWPEDTHAYFGNGDEFHMAFNFPIMPRLFMAIRTEDHFPVMDILNETPPIPETSQWAIFLRNHDELTLEMVTEEERDYMYRMYCADPAAKLNLGIRRRLAPLLNNDRRKIELMNGLLFSLPGSPVIYYGDEIGMGDNYYLGDRNGVRNPMQWSPDRNAGFSTANPQKLYLPTIIDPEYHYEAVNVETQRRNTDSLFWWMKRTISLRKKFLAFGRGNIKFIETGNHKVLAYLRCYAEEVILVVANLSHAAQQVKVELGEFADYVPVELFGRIEFAPIGTSPYILTLGAYGFYWFAMKKRVDQASMVTDAVAPSAKPPAVSLDREHIFADESFSELETVLQDYVVRRRWFRGKSMGITSANIKDVIQVRSAPMPMAIVTLEFVYTEGEPETYIVPLAAITGRTCEQPEGVIAVLEKAPEQGDGTSEYLVDVMLDRNACNFLVDAIEGRRRFHSKHGEVLAHPTRAFSMIRGPRDIPLEPIPATTDQTNSLVAYSDKLILKLFRRVESGTSLDLEVGRFLTEKGFPNTAPVAGYLEYRTGKRDVPSDLAILHGYVRNEGDAWRFTLDALDRYFKQVQVHTSVEVPPTAPTWAAALRQDSPPLAQETIGAFLPSMDLLGKRTAELHLCLSSAPEEPDFAPEPFTLMHQTALYQSMRALTIRTMRLVRERLNDLPADVAVEAHKVLDLESTIIERFGPIKSQIISAWKIRSHGDYHLGQVIFTGKDFVIIDFEGEPAKPLSERRLKRCPLRDVAGMIRSLHYASHTALAKQVPLFSRPQEELPRMRHWANFWYSWVSSAFLRSYLKVIEPAHLLPEDPVQLELLLKAYLLEKAVYEIGYELNNRPSWVSVPLLGVQQLIEAGLQRGDSQQANG